ncbi:MAG: hypothetical protein OHK0036_08120 [Bacteroidia bacterium]
MNLIDSILFRINKWFVRPVIIQLKVFNHKKLLNTRVSTMVFFDGKKNIELDNHVFIGHFCFIEGSNGLKIEEGVQITNFVSITTHSSHISIRLYGKEYSSYKNHIGYVKGPVRIGAYSFIGPHTLIMPNTNIGKGCIVKAYSLVKGTFPDFSIIEGNPARIVGSTKDIDNSFLKEHSFLIELYNEWANKNI